MAKIIPNEKLSYNDIQADIVKRASWWIVSQRTDLSSTTIWGVLMGVPAVAIDADVPANASDFNRCAELLELIPEWKPRLQEVAAAFPEWKGIVLGWDRLYARLLDLRASMATQAQHEAYLRFREELDRCTGQE